MSMPRYFTLDNGTCKLIQLRIFQLIIDNIFGHIYHTKSDEKVNPELWVHHICYPNSLPELVLADEAKRTHALFTRKLVNSPSIVKKSDALFWGSHWKALTVHVEVVTSVPNLHVRTVSVKVDLWALTTRERLCVQVGWLHAGSRGFCACMRSFTPFKRPALRPTVGVEDRCILLAKLILIIGHMVALRCQKRGWESVQWSSGRFVIELLCRGAEHGKWIELTEVMLAPFVSVLDRDVSLKRPFSPEHQIGVE